MLAMLQTLCLARLGNLLVRKLKFYPVCFSSKHVLAGSA